MQDGVSNRARYRLSSCTYRPSPAPHECGHAGSQSRRRDVRRQLPMRFVCPRDAHALQVGRIAICMK
jgi:hypothetical protein